MITADLGAAQLGRARRGDEAAAAALVRERWPELWRIAVSVTGSTATAEDVVQDVFERAFGDLDRFATPVDLRAWLRRVTVNRALDVRARERQRPQREASVALGSGSGEAVVFNWATHDEPLMSACRRLSPKHRHVVLLRYWADLSLEEIADALVLPLGTVRSRLSRALAQLRDELGGAT